MPIEWSETSQHKQELNKWNRPRNQYVEKPNGEKEYGMNAVGFEPYPRMLYKAQYNDHTKRHEVVMHRDVISLDKTVVISPSAEQFNTSCQLIVNSDEEYRRARADGWRDSRKEAEDYHKALQDAISDAAAYRAAEDSKMSAKAQAEAAAAEASTDKQLGEIPAKPVDRMAKARAAKAAKKAGTAV